MTGALDATTLWRQPPGWSSTGGAPDRGGHGCVAMDLPFLIILVAAIVVAMLALARLLTRPQAPASEATAGDSPIAVSTEGMKICPRCGMGNLWTERRCISCGASLKG